VSQTEDQQIQELKEKWEQYGKYVIIALIAVVSGVIGGQSWNAYKEGDLERASASYDVMMEAMQEKQVEIAMSEGGRLIESHPNSPYATMAALAVAKMEVEKGDTQSARTRLAWAIDHANMEGLAHVARLRLAQLMIDAGELDPALTKLNISETGKFEGTYAALRGDIYVLQGKRSEARTAYESALTDTELSPQLRTFVQMKLDNLGSAVSNETAS